MNLDFRRRLPPASRGDEGWNGWEEDMVDDYIIVLRVGPTVGYSLDAESHC